MSQSTLRFSLKEAVWFKRGQEVENLLSIEINPQIEIEEQSSYVQVVGALELYGEYEQKVEDETFSLRDFSQTKLMDDVETREDGICVFTNYFPIDITIPKSRVENCDDIFIDIESFDYEIRNNNELHILADLSISGLNDELEEELEEVAEEETEPLEDIFEELVFEARKVPDTTVEETVTIREQLQELHEEEEEHPQLEFLSRTESVFIHDYTEEVQKEVDRKEFVEEETDTLEVHEKRNENDLSLTRLFSHQEETFKKVRMYIVQSGDTVDSIAEKYELQVGQITRRNKLEFGQVTEGQILYLPARKLNQ